jgi:hypothetical protein
MWRVPGNSHGPSVRSGGAKNRLTKSQSESSKPTKSLIQSVHGGDLQDAVRIV